LSATPSADKSALFRLTDVLRAGFDAILVQREASNYRSSNGW
jgi:hypothetical protein